MDILEITGWVATALFASGVCLVLDFIFGFLVVNEINFTIADEIFNKILSYSISVFYGIWTTIRYNIQVIPG